MKTKKRVFKTPEEKATFWLNQLKGRRSKRKGDTNEDRSVKYVLTHPDKYGDLKLDRIEIAKKGIRKGVFTVDFFKLWDIITCPSYSSTLQSQTKMIDKDLIPFMYFIQVKSNDLPEASYLQKLYNFKVPFYIKKELHIWKDDKEEPIIINLDNEE